MKKLRAGLALFVCTVAVAATASSASANGWHWWDFHWPDHLPLYLTERLDDSAIDPVTDPPGYMWSGSGNSVEGFLLQQNPWTHTELALKGKYRQGNDIAPTFIGGDDAVHIVVPDGPQVIDPAHGVPVAHAGRAAWNFDFSLSTALDGSTKDLDDYDAWLLFDLDPSVRTKFLTTKLTKITPTPPAGESGYGWKVGTTFVIDDDGGTSQVTQNSFNYAFIASLIDTDPGTAGIQPYTFGPAEFDVIIAVRKRFGPEINRIHAVFNVMP
jgi:hypothetical protein